MRKAKITAVGCYTPPNLLTNDDLSKMVDTNDQWILERTGYSNQAYCSARYGHFGHGRRGCQGHVSECGCQPRRDRLHSALHRHPGHDVSIDGVPCSTPPRMHSRLGIRSDRRVLGICVWTDDGRALRRCRHTQESSRHRGRYDVAHHRLHGSHHMRPFRRRRGSDAGRAER